MSRRLTAALALVLASGAAACDDQLKYVPVFSSMAQQPSLEAYEQPSRQPPAGAVELGTERSRTLLEADSLVSPLAASDVDLDLGGEQFLIFCSVCHGADARGRGPVVGPNRIPEIPTLNLHSEQARGYTDGYIWGMITNGRGLMPSYRRIPSEVRWQIVAYLRAVQSGEVEPPTPTATAGLEASGDSRAPMEGE